MKYVEKQGKTVEIAITDALVEMGLTSDKVVVEVIDEGPKGIFKLFSGKKATVRVYKKINLESIAKKFLEDVFANMNVSVDIETSLNENDLDILLSGGNMGLLIGKRGQTLDSLQYLVSLVVNKASDSYIRVKLDTENYRGKRKETLEKLSYSIAKKVKKTNRKQFLEPMNPNDRRIIHSTLQGFNGVTTFSEGNEPFRKVVIVPSSKANANSSEKKDGNKKKVNNKNNNNKNNKNNNRNRNKNYKNSNNKNRNKQPAKYKEKSKKSKEN